MNVSIKENAIVMKRSIIFSKEFLVNRKQFFLAGCRLVAVRRLVDLQDDVMCEETPGRFF